MAKSRVKGITIEIGGNTVGLDKALAGTNKNIGTTQSRLKDVERLLKLDPKNTVLLEQKQELLAQAVHETEQKLRTLNEANDQVADSVKNYDAWKQAYDPIQEEITTTQEKLKKLKAEQSELKDCGEVDTDAYRKLQEEVEETSRHLRDLKDRAKEVNDQFDNPVNPDQYDALQREIIETENNLKNLRASAEKNMDAIGDACDDTKRRMEAIGDAAKSVKSKADAVADAFRPATTAVAGLATAAAATVPATEELREDLSRLDANAADNAVSVDAARKAWKEFAVQSGETDSAVEAVSNLLQAGFTESNLQKAVENLAGAAQRFPDTLKVESLADSLQETLATGGATGQYAELLERLGLDLEAFDEQMAECATDAEKQNLALQVLADAGLTDSYNAWKQNNEEMLRNKEANLQLETSMAQLAEKVMPIVTDVTEAVVRFLDWFNNLSPAAQGAIVSILAVVAAISPMASAIGGAADLIDMLSQVNLPGLTGVFDFLTGTVLPGVQGAFSSVFGFIAANPVVLLIGAIVGMVALFATKGDEIQEKLQQIDDFLQDIFLTDWTEVFGPGLGDVLNGFWAIFEDVWNFIYKILHGAIDFIRGVFTGDWERAWQGVVDIFEGIFSGLELLLTAPINGVIGLVNSAISGINWLIEGVNKIPGVNLDTIGKIPYLADGGEVFRGSAIVGEAGPELLTVLGDRTVVQPLTNNNTTHNAYMGGLTVNVYGAPGQDVRELAAEVAEELQHMADCAEEGLQ